MQRQSARAIIFNKGNPEEIYLIHRIKDKREYYVIPGGGIEENETPLETVEREILEETGITMRDIKELPNVEYEIDGRTDMFYLFTAHENKKIIPTGDEMQNKYTNNFYELITCKIDKIENLNLKPKELINIIKEIK